jgi:hypothetical protein
VIITYLRQFEAPRKVRSHYVAPSFVENWLFDTRIGRTQGFPVPKRCSGWFYVAIANSHRFQRDLRAFWEEYILADDLSTECRKIMSLKNWG